MAKKKTPKATGAKVDVPEVKATPKTKAAPKVEKTDNAKAEKEESKKPKRPAWLYNCPSEYTLASPDYRAMIEDHNKLFGTAHNPWRVRPAVMFDIYDRIRGHYDGK